MILDSDPQRRKLMARVRRTGTAPELVLRRALFADGLRYRLSARHLEGSPDLIFVRARVAVFVDGCFWHGCPEHGSWPKRNAPFWRSKILRNRERDARVDASLHAHGWHVIRVWEHEVSRNVQSVVDRVRCAIEKPARDARRAAKASARVLL